VASVIERERTYQVVVHCQRRRYKVPGFLINSIGKGLSEELGRNVEKLLACKAAGAIPPDLRRYVEALPVNIRASMAVQEIIDAAAEGKKLAEHVADFEAALLAKGNTPQHVAATANALRTMFEAAGCKMLGDVTGAKVRAYMAVRRADRAMLDAAGKPKRGADCKPIVRRGISARRHNAMLTALGGFFRWCMRERRVFENPTINVPKLNEKIDKRHDRRALTADEVRSLLMAAVAGGDLYGVSGAERDLIYRMAVETGLRMNELATLTRGCVDLKGLTVTVRAAYSKHRREDVVPMRSELAEALREHAEHKAPAARLFTMPNRFRMLDAFKADLMAAGIPRHDDAGRVVDFHGLRHTFITSLAIGGIHPKTAQTLARHSTITLTMDRYTHTLRGAEVAALNSLPDYATPTAATAKRTGTNSVPVDSGSAARKTTANSLMRKSASYLGHEGGMDGSAPTPEIGVQIRGARGAKQWRHETTVDNDKVAVQKQETPTNSGLNLHLSGIAGGGSRTHTSLRTQDFESSASASSATPASRGLYAASPKKKKDALPDSPP
jgi:integrase